MQPKVASGVWVVALILYPLLTFFDFLVTRSQTGFLDNSVHYVSYQLFFSHLLNGKLPLWTACQAGGMPLWPLVDIHSVFDPVVWLIYLIAKMTGTSGFHAFQWCIAWWLSCFALGIYFLLRAWWVSTDAAGLASFVALASAASLLSFMQANGYWLHAYVAPWILWLLTELHRAPDGRRIFLLGILVGFWLNGYSAPLVLIISLLAASSYFLWRKKLPLPSLHSLFLFGIPLAPFALANLLVLQKTQTWTNVARLAEPGGNSGKFVLSFLAPFFVSPTGTNVITEGLKEIPNFIGSISPELFFFSGSIPVFLLLLAWINRRELSIPQGMRGLALFAALVFLGFCGGGQALAHLWSEDGVFLFYRNWRFLYPYLLLAFALSFGLALDQLARHAGRIQLRSSAGIWLLGIFAGYGLLQHFYAMLFAPYAKLVFRLFFPLLVWTVYQSLQRRRRPSAATLFLAVALVGETTFFIRKWAPEILPRSRMDILAREPSLELRECPLPERRREIFPLTTYAPFHKEGPAVWAIPSVYFDWEVNEQPSYLQNRRAIQYFYPAASHWFEPTRYLDYLKTAAHPLDWAGASGPTIRSLRCETDLKDGCHPLEPPKILINEPTRLHLQSGNLPFPNYIYVANGWDADWRVTIDNQPASLLPAQLAFQAVAVPSGGPHEIEFTYRPWTWLLTFWSRLAVVLTGIGILISYLNPKRRPKRTEDSLSTPGNGPVKAD